MTLFQGAFLNLFFGPVTYFATSRNQFNNIGRSTIMFHHNQLSVFKVVWSKNVDAWWTMHNRKTSHNSLWALCSHLNSKLHYNVPGTVQCMKWRTDHNSTSLPDEMNESKLMKHFIAYIFLRTKHRMRNTIFKVVSQFVTNLDIKLTMQCDWNENQKMSQQYLSFLLCYLQSPLHCLQSI